MTTANPKTEKPAPIPAPAKVAAKAPVKTQPKAAAKPVANPAAKPVAKAAPVAKPAAKPAVKTPVVKATKAKKPKMVRDSFTFPKDEYAVLDILKLRAAKLGSPIKKTELLRAGVKAIAAMSDAAFLAALQAVPSLKTGRPAKGN
jgi:hypothetical protein